MRRIWGSQLWADWGLGCWVLLSASLGCLAQEEVAETASTSWAIVIHGGAGDTPIAAADDATKAKRAVLEKALFAGREILEEGGSSLDAVETVIRILEDDPHYNAGKGAVKNAQGRHELDASIMDGSNLACGAVAGVTTVKNPISLARRVMTETRHVLLQGLGAEAFAREQGVELVENDYFDVSWRGRELPNRGPGSEPRDQAQVASSYKGTVGCVALDRNGHLAAGTSTGGLAGKQFGRVGDSPIIGAGTYANDKTCGVSCTGTGEEYIRNAAAYTVSALIEFKGWTVDQAVDEVMRRRLKPGDGGLIAISADGQICADFTTPAMAWATADATGRFEVHWGDEASRQSENARKNR